MKASFFILLLFLFSQSVLADECDFDQKERIKENIRLKNKYPESYLIEDNLILVVPVNEGEVRINIGGCVHYGVTIELKTENKDKYEDDDDFMEQILRLAMNYSQGYIDIGKLKTVIDNKKWVKSQSSRRYYLFEYDDISTFEVYEHDDGKYTVIGFSNYS